jgi:hypothetical protein
MSQKVLARLEKVKNVASNRTSKLQSSIAEGESGSGSAADPMAIQNGNSASSEG